MEQLRLPKIPMPPVVTPTAIQAKLILFCDPAFPIEGQQPSRQAMEHWKSLESKGILIADAHGLADALQAAGGEGCFINLHAPYFPKSAWTAIVDYLHQGGGLISIGGAPFKRPVRAEHETWVVESEQTAYHQELYIHETIGVSTADVQSYVSSESIPLLAGKEELLEVADTWNLVPHTTKTSDLPHQMGSAGTMSTQIHALLTGINQDGRSIAAPMVLWENIRGSFGGSRWLFVNLPLTDSFWTQNGAAEIVKWGVFCAQGVTELSLKPNYASYEPGERVVLTLQGQILQRTGFQRTGLQRTGFRCSAFERWTFALTVVRENRMNGQTEPVWNHQLEMHISDEQQYVRLSLPKLVEPGLYRIVCRAEAPDGEIRVLRQGFWGQDTALLAEGEGITRSRDYFIQAGQPLPVVGMTYMTSDVARKFLFLPNTDVWDRDMEQMAKAGINWIRTGIWTAYRNMMQVDGHMAEDVLRAIDAFFLTAKRHGLQVTFTFFSFTPETWEGVNPYLDPQSVEAQKRFIRSVVSRHIHSTHVDWDLINEPSMFDPARIFSAGPRSSRDMYEQQAFMSWLQKRHEMIESLQEAWNMSPRQLPSFADAVIPEPEEINFDVQDMHQPKKGTRWLDYCLFSMEMHNVWAQELVSTIKDLAPKHLVTIGQDEALGAQRPSPFFYEREVDYTTVHSWWLNDDLLWDGIFAKTPNKPNLIQETGMMYVETPDGRAKRTEAELHSILERKYAYAFATGGAGAVQWIWNTNFYMDNANESHIGALRADGTEKPEANVSYDFGRFMREVRELFEDRELEQIAVVFPYSNDFSNRSLAYDATTRLTRVLSYELKLPFRALSEYHLDSLEHQPPKLVIVPSPHNLEDAAFRRLIEFTEKQGASLLITGPLGIDAYWKPSRRADMLVGKRNLANVQREEVLHLNGANHRVTYGRRRIAEVVKEMQVLLADGQKGHLHPSLDADAIDEMDTTKTSNTSKTSPSPKADRVTVVPLGEGKGKLIWTPLPLELNGRDEPLVELYRYAAATAGVERELEWLSGGQIAGIYGRKLHFSKGNLYIFVSEYAWNEQVRIRDQHTGVTYSFELQSNRSVLFATDSSGKLRAVYRPEEVEIEIIQQDVKEAY
ncbi:Beta-galactosidase [Paenibacillus polysaccharolyticus]|uniref:Beta-galactosidase n=1 Tax=Paenibacillus polysaccharolyticus TaxID=582692 RepID=A0A1G5HS64_9BACL|nr:alpha-amylase family protein [Paenibacillus polysaccharolyticus]SCY66636.1 Beta-galactosidase [Paenibacillus polysaccharolyticus]